MSPRRFLEAAKLAELADRLAACLGPSMLAEDAPKPDSLPLAAWHAMNALQRVAELLPDGQLADEPDARFESLTDLAARGEGIVQATIDTLIAEGHAEPVVKPTAVDGHAGATTKPEAALLRLEFPGEEPFAFPLTRSPDTRLRLGEDAESKLHRLDPAAREAVAAAVAEVAHVMVSALS